MDAAICDTRHRRRVTTRLYSLLAALRPIRSLAGLSLRDTPGTTNHQVPCKSVVSCDTIVIGCAKISSNGGSAPTTD